MNRSQLAAAVPRCCCHPLGVTCYCWSPPDDCWFLLVRSLSMLAVPVQPPEPPLLLLLQLTLLLGAPVSLAVASRHCHQLIVVFSCCSWLHHLLCWRRSRRYFPQCHGTLHLHRGQKPPLLLQQCLCCSTTIDAASRLLIRYKKKRLIVNFVASLKVLIGCHNIYKSAYGVYSRFCTGGSWFFSPGTVPSLTYLCTITRKE